MSARRELAAASDREAVPEMQSSLSTPLGRSDTSTLSDLPLTDRIALAEKLRQLEFMASSLLTSTNAAAVAQSGDTRLV